MDGLGPRGSRLWTSLLKQDSRLEDESNPLREVALDACSTADIISDLETMLATESDEAFRVRLMSELRQQKQASARLISALRLPDEASGKRPQRRQLRGVQQPSAVSSLERARKRAGA